MPNNEQDPNNDTTKQSVSVMMERDLYDIIFNLATDNDRTLAAQVRRMLRTHPQVKTLLKAEGQGVAA